MAQTARPGVDTPARRPPVHRSAADRRMRWLLRLPEDAPRVSIFEAQTAFGRSLAISAVRCTLTYVVIPLLGPVLGLSGVLGPILGLALGAISIVAIVVATRRLFAADHKWRWPYTFIGGGIIVLLLIGEVVDVQGLLS